MELDLFTEKLHDNEVLFQNLNLLGFDKTQNEKDFKVLIQRDMFNKINQKGLAILLYFLLCHMKPEFKGKYAMCWFPYTMAEMKEFKKITLEYFNILQTEGLVPHSQILSKSVLETASGRRVWEMLRYLSDYAIRIEIYRNDPHYSLPEFMMTLSEYKEQVDTNENGDELTTQIDVPSKE